MMEMTVITETNVRRGRRYRSARKASKGNRDMARKLIVRRTGVNEPANPFRQKRKTGARRGRKGNGAPGGIRTHDQLIKSQLLYQLSYRGNQE